MQISNSFYDLNRHIVEIRKKIEFNVYRIYYGSLRQFFTEHVWYTIVNEVI